MRSARALLFTFLIIWSGILPVLSLQSSTGISSYGTIDYSTTGLLRWHVDGKYLKDANGNIVILRGVNLQQDYWWDTDVAYNENQFIYMENWGINSVRITIWTSLLEVVGLNYAPLLTRLDNLINWANAHGIYVILSGWHAGGVVNGIWTNSPPRYMEGQRWTWQQWYDWWALLAARYASKNIIYDVYNEPLEWGFADHQTRIRTVIDNYIRPNDPDSIVMVEAISPDSDWTHQNFLFEQTYPINRSNVIFDFHIYGSEWAVNSQADIRTRLAGNYKGGYSTWMITNNRAVISGEFGSDNTGNNPQSDAWCQTFISNFMAVLDTDGFSGYIAWLWFLKGANYNVWHHNQLLADWNGNPSSYGNVVKTHYLAPAS